MRKELKVYLSEAKHKELKHYCFHIGLSMSNFVNIAIREKIKRDLETRKK